MSKDGVVRIFSMKYKEAADLTKECMNEANEYMS